MSIVNDFKEKVLGRKLRDYVIAGLVALGAAAAWFGIVDLQPLFDLIKGYISAAPTPTP